MMKSLAFLVFFLLVAAGDLSAQVTSPESQPQADGLAWREVNTGQSKVVYNMDFINDSIIWAKTPDFLMRSSDLGETWQHVLAPAGKDSVMYSQFLTDSLGYCSIRHSPWLQRTTDGGRTWTSRHTLMSGHPWGFKMFDTTHGIAWSLIQKAQTQDAGRTWLVKYHEDIKDLSMADRLHGFLVGASHPWIFQTFPERRDAAHFARTTDAGRSWEEVFPGIDENWYKVEALDNQNLVVSGNGIYWSSNAGDTWNGSEGVEGSGVGINFYDRYNGYSSRRYGILLRTSDGGRTWRRVASPTSSHLLATYFLDSLTGFLSSVDALYKTTTGGRSWVQLDPTQKFVSRLYPSPARDHIRIEIELVHAMHITVDIIDAAGRVVQTAADARLYGPGQISIPITVAQLVSGSYYCRWSTDGQLNQTIPFSVLR